MNSDAFMLKNVDPDDLIKYGIIPELAGRLPVTTVLDKLDKKSYFRILEEPKNSFVKQYTKTFELMGIQLTFTHAFLAYVVDEAFQRNLGVRALRSIMEKYIMPLIYHITNYKSIKKFIINEKLIEVGAEEYCSEFVADLKSKKKKLGEVS